MKLKINTSSRDKPREAAISEDLVLCKENSATNLDQNIDELCHKNNISIYPAFARGSLK